MTLFAFGGTNVTTSGIVDVLVPIGLLCAGLSLMLGLYTQLGAWVAFLFLTLFYIAYIPTAGVPAPNAEGTYLIVNKTLVELAAVGVLLAFRTGEMAGLDLLRTAGNGRGEHPVNGRWTGSDQRPQSTRIVHVAVDPSAAVTGSRSAVSRISGRYVNAATRPLTPINNVPHAPLRRIPALLAVRVVGVRRDRDRPRRRRRRRAGGGRDGDRRRAGRAGGDERQRRRVLVRRPAGRRLRPRRPPRRIRSLGDTSHDRRPARCRSCASCSCPARSATRSWSPRRAARRARRTRRRRPR